MYICVEAIWNLMSPTKDGETFYVVSREVFGCCSRVPASPHALPASPHALPLGGVSIAAVLGVFRMGHM